MNLLGVLGRLDAAARGAVVTLVLCVWPYK